MTHLAIQQALQELFSPYASLEVRFPSIDRIADVCLEPHKLIFEIQCSPMPLKELKERLHDYSRAGYRVIWILHDKTFRKARLSAVEAYLRPWTHFFTNMNEAGEGIFYAEHPPQGPFRTAKSSPTPVDPKKWPATDWKWWMPPEKKRRWLLFLKSLLGDQP